MYFSYSLIILILLSNNIIFLCQSIHTMSGILLENLYAILLKDLRIARVS